MKIRGNTVGTPLRPGRGVVKATDLTKEEKAQARQNIGAAEDCGLEQPVWGVSIETVGTETRECEQDSEGICYILVTPEEYAAIIAVEELGEELPLDRLYYDKENGRVCHIDDFKITIAIQKKTIIPIPAEYLDVGDIATALDHIIALQEELMA